MKLDAEWLSITITLVGGSYGVCLMLIAGIIRKFLLGYERFKEEVMTSCGESAKDREELDECKIRCQESKKVFERLEDTLQELQEGQKETRGMIQLFTENAATTDRIILGTLVQICEANNLRCADIGALYAEMRSAAFRDLARGAK